MQINKRVRNIEKEWATVFLLILWIVKHTHPNGMWAYNYAFQLEFLMQFDCFSADVDVNQQHTLSTHTERES